MSNVGVAVANASSALFATAVLSQAERGAMVVALTIGTIVVMSAGLGSGQALRSTLPSLVGSARVSLATAYSWLTLFSGLAGAVVVSTAFFYLSPLVDGEMRSGRLIGSLALVTAAQIVLQQFNDRLFAEENYALASLWSGAAGVVALIAAISSVQVLKESWFVLLFQGCGLSLVCLLQGLVLYKRKLLYAKRPRVSDVKILTSSGVRALGLNVGLVVALRSDRYILGVVAGPAAVSIYALAATLSEMPKLVTSALGQLFFQDVAKSRTGPSTREIAIRAACITSVVSIFLGAAGWFVVIPLTGSDFLSARPLLLLLLVAEICMGPYVVLSRGILGGGWSRVAGLVGCVASVVALVVYCVFIPIGNEYGAAGSSIAIYAGLSIASWFVLRSLTRRSIDGSHDAVASRSAVRR